MVIWVDADACPREAKELVFKTAVRVQIKARVVANMYFRIPQSEWISFDLVGAGLDVADNYIVENIQENDLVITADIPLAARIVDAGAVGLDPRGFIFDEDNVKNRLATRNLFADLREEGHFGGGPPPYKPKDRSNFASALDRLITKLKQNR